MSCSCYYVAFLKKKLYHNLQQSHQLTVNQTEYDESLLEELLQKSAIEHLTEFRETLVL